MPAGTWRKISGGVHPLHRNGACVQPVPGLLTGLFLHGARQCTEKAHQQTERRDVAVVSAGRDNPPAVFSGDAVHGDCPVVVGSGERQGERLFVQTDFQAQEAEQKVLKRVLVGAYTANPR